MITVRCHTPGCNAVAIIEPGNPAGWSIVRNAKPFQGDAAEVWVPRCPECGSDVAEGVLIKAGHRARAKVSKLEKELQEFRFERRRFDR